MPETPLPRFLEAVIDPDLGKLKDAFEDPSAGDVYAWVFDTSETARPEAPDQAQDQSGRRKRRATEAQAPKGKAASEKAESTAENPSHIVAGSDGSGLWEKEDLLALAGGMLEDAETIVGFLTSPAFGLDEAAPEEIWTTLHRLGLVPANARPREVVEAINRLSSLAGGDEVGDTQVFRSDFLDTLRQSSSDGEAVFIQSFNTVQAFVERFRKNSGTFAELMLAGAFLSAFRNEERPDASIPCMLIAADLLSLKSPGNSTARRKLVSSLYYLLRRDPGLARFTKYQPGEDLQQWFDKILARTRTAVQGFRLVGTGVNLTDSDQPLRHWEMWKSIEERREQDEFVLDMFREVDLRDGTSLLALSVTSGKEIGWDLTTAAAVDRVPAWRNEFIFEMIAYAMGYGVARYVKSDVRETPVAGWSDLLFAVLAPALDPDTDADDRDGALQDRPPVKMAALALFILGFDFLSEFMPALAREGLLPGIEIDQDQWNVYVALLQRDDAYVGGKNTERDGYIVTIVEDAPTAITLQSVDPYVGSIMVRRAHYQQVVDFLNALYSDGLGYQIHLPPAHRIVFYFDYADAERRGARRYNPADEFFAGKTAVDPLTQGSSDEGLLKRLVGGGPSHGLSAVKRDTLVFSDLYRQLPEPRRDVSFTPDDDAGKF